MKVRSEFLASHLVQPVLQGVPVGVNVAGRRFYYVHLLPSARVANSKDAQTNRDKITPNLPELSLSLVFSGHGSTLRGLRQRIYALSAERRPKKS